MRSSIEEANLNFTLSDASQPAYELHANRSSSAARCRLQWDVLTTTCRSMQHASRNVTVHIRLYSYAAGLSGSCTGVCTAVGSDMICTQCRVLAWYQLRARRDHIGIIACATSVVSCRLKTRNQE